MSLLHFKIENRNFSFTEEHFSGSRGESIVKLTVDALKYVYIPPNIKLEWSVHAGDCPLEHANIEKSSNVFSVVEYTENIDRAYPCWFFQGLPEINCPDYEDLINNLEETGNITPLYNKILWRGANSSIKDKLCEIGKKYDWTDFKIVNGVQLPFTDYTKWKYLIDVEGCAFGGGYSARIKALMFTKRVLFIQDRTSWDMIRNILRDGINCIFIKNDMSDLEEKYKWIEEKGPEFQKKMALQLFEDANKFCRRGNAHNRIRKLIINLMEYNCSNRI